MHREQHPPPESQPTDEDLVPGALAGNAACWDELIKRYTRRLLAFFRNCGASVEEAEDLSQDIWEKLLTGKLQRFRDRGPGSFKGWLFTVARRVRSDHYRRCIAQKRAGQVGLDDAYEAEATGPGPPQTVEIPEVLDEVVAKIMDVRDEVERLPANERAVFNEIFVAGNKQNQVATNLGLKAPRVSQIKTGALRRLSERLHVHPDTLEQILERYAPLLWDACPEEPAA